MRSTPEDVDALAVRIEALARLDEGIAAQSLFERDYPKERASSLLLAALSHSLLDQDDPADALRYAEQAVAKNANEGAAWQVCAEVYRQEQKPAQAREALSHAKRLLPNDAFTHRVEVLICIDDDDAAGAIEADGRLLPAERMPQDEHCLAVAHMALGEVRRAIDVLLACTEPSPHACADLLTWLIAEDRLEEAVRHGERQAARHKSDAVLAHKWGLAVWLLSGPQQAVAIMREAVRRDSSSAEALGQLSYVLHDAGAVLEAEKWARRAIRIDPSFGGYVQLAYALCGQDRTTETIAALERATALGPDTKSQWYLIAELYATLGHDASARHAYEQALAHDADWGEGWLRLGRLLAKSPDATEAAIAALQTATRFGAHRFEALRQLSPLYRRAGHPMRAAAADERALAMRPDHWDVQQSLIDHAWNRRLFSLALAHYDARRRSSPLTPPMRSDRAYCLDWTGQTKEAEAEYERLMAESPSAHLRRRYAFWQLRHTSVDSDAFAEALTHVLATDHTARTPHADPAVLAAKLRRDDALTQGRWQPRWPWTRQWTAALFDAVAWALRRDGHAPLLQAWCAHALGEAPDLPSLSVRAAQHLIYLGLLPQAQQLLERVEATAWPRNKHARKALGDAFFELADHKRASEHYQSVLERYPRHTDAIACLAAAQWQLDRPSVACALTLGAMVLTGGPKKTAEQRPYVLANLFEVAPDGAFLAQQRGAVHRLIDAGQSKHVEPAVWLAVERQTAGPQAALQLADRLCETHPKDPKVWQEVCASLAELRETV